MVQLALVVVLEILLGPQGQVGLQCINKWCLYRTMLTKRACANAVSKSICICFDKLVSANMQNKPTRKHISWQCCMQRAEALATDVVCIAC